jgi:hypothetical protein
MLRRQRAAATPDFPTRTAPAPSSLSLPWANAELSVRPEARAEARAATFGEQTRHRKAAEVGMTARHLVCNHLRDDSMAVKVTMNLPHAGTTVEGAEGL